MLALSSLVKGVWAIQPVAGRRLFYAACREKWAADTDRSQQGSRRRRGTAKH
jgi:hypothetical protein